MGLSNYQLILLDNLIYLDGVTRAITQQDTIGSVVHNLLYAEGSNEAGTGTIIQDCQNTYQGEDSQNCMMNQDEWVQVLKAIEADEELCSLKIHSVENDRENGFRAMALTGENIDENVIIFKGTTSAYEWIDNAIGGYSVETEEYQDVIEKHGLSIYMIA